MPGAPLPAEAGSSLPLAAALFSSLLASFVWIPFRHWRRRLLGASCGGLGSAVLTLALTGLPGWSLLALGLGTFFGLVGPGAGRVVRRSYVGSLGWGGGFRGAFGVGFGGGGGRIGGGGASQRW